MQQKILLTSPKKDLVKYSKERSISFFMATKKITERTKKGFYKSLSNQDFDHDVNVFYVSMTATH
jgi:hypothetical protein